MYEINQLITGLAELSGAAVQQKTAVSGCDIDIRIDRDRLQDCAKLLLAHDFYLSFLTAVHVSPACEVLYRFGHYEASCRIQLRVSAGEDKTVSSIALIYQSADWHEREVHDFFGIIFSGHPNLKPLILTREERDFKPLLKSGERLKNIAEIFPPPAAAEPE